MKRGQDIFLKGFVEGKTSKKEGVPRKTPELSTRLWGGGETGSSTKKRISIGIEKENTC